MKKTLAITFALASLCSAEAQEFISIDGELFEASKLKGFSYEIDKNRLPFAIMNDPKATIFGAALEATEVYKRMWTYQDLYYESETEVTSYYAHGHYFNSYPIKSRKYGYTGFVVTDDVLKEKYNVQTLEDLYKLACQEYDEVYPEDVARPEHAFDHLTDSINPLYRFISYHFLNRDLGDYGFYPIPKTYSSTGVHSDIRAGINPTEWYQTLLPNSLVKLETIKDNWVLNHSDDAQIAGATADNMKMEAYDNQTSNGSYYYIDDILSYGKETRTKVGNSRMRFDFIGYFPELTNNQIRCTTSTAEMGTNSYDLNCFLIQNGYLDGLKVMDEALKIQSLCPYYNLCMNADFISCQNGCNLIMKLPPVPFDGIWQLRISNNAGDARPYVQFKLGESPDQMEQIGEIVDMRKRLFDYGCNLTCYSEMTTKERAEEREMLMKQGILRGPAGYFIMTGTTPYDNTSGMLYRYIIGSVAMKANKDYYLQINTLIPENEESSYEFSLDYFEIVPQSVYEGNEDDF